MADPTPAEILQELVRFTAQMTEDYASAANILQGLDRMARADETSDVTIKADPDYVVPSIKKMYKAYSDAVSTAATIGAAIAQQINDEIANKRTQFATQSTNAQNDLALTRAAALQAVATALSGALTDVASARSGALTDIENARSTALSNIQGAKDGAEAFKNLAQKWAEFEGEIEPGKRSAKYWATEAQQSGDVALVRQDLDRLTADIYLGIVP